MYELEAKIMSEVAEGNLAAFRKIVELYQMAGRIPGCAGFLKFKEGGLGVHGDRP